MDGFALVDERRVARDHEEPAQLGQRGDDVLADAIGKILLLRIFKTIGKYMPPPAGVKSPALWGTRDRLVEMFGLAAVSIETEPRNFNFRYRSAEHWLDVFKTYYGPMLKAFAALDEPKQNGLRNDLHALIARMNKANDGTMVVPSEYLEVVITKR